MLFSKKVSDTLERCASHFDFVNVLFNNAGIMEAADGGLETEDAVWDRTLAVNVKGVWNGCRLGVPHLLRSEGASSVINTASFVAMRGAATPQIAYTASKGAVLSMTKELAVLYAKQGVRFNNLCPGPLRTELLMKVLDTDEKKQRRLVHIPMARVGEAAEMANAALFLASDESSYSTGSEFVADGGLLAVGDEVL